MSLRELAGQTSFAWTCDKITPSEHKYGEPTVCNVAGAERTAYALHMSEVHGKTALKPPARIRLRKTAPAARRQPPRVPPFKRYLWTTTDEHTGQAAEHRGQFWANGPVARSVIVIEDCRPEPNRLVTLWLAADGTLSAGYIPGQGAGQEEPESASEAAA